jgi:hypothetical protein
MYFISVFCEVGTIIWMNFILRLVKDTVSPSSPFDLSCIKRMYEKNATKNKIVVQCKLLRQWSTGYAKAVYQL